MGEGRRTGRGHRALRTALPDREHVTVEVPGNSRYGPSLAWRKARRSPPWPRQSKVTTAKPRASRSTRFAIFLDEFGRPCRMQTVPQRLPRIAPASRRAQRARHRSRGHAHHLPAIGGSYSTRFDEFASQPPPPYDRLNPGPRAARGPVGPWAATRRALEMRDLRFPPHDSASAMKAARDNRSGPFADHSNRMLLKENVP